MKIAQAALFATAIIGDVDAMSFRGFRGKGNNNAAVDEAEETIATDTNDTRELQSLNNCWGDDPPAAAWHPVYAAGWTNGYCRETVDCNSPAYSTQLECCKGAYAGQMSGYCLSQLPSPPTTSPTDTGGLDVYYPDYNTPWPDAYCINTRPMPSGRPTYSTMLECCKGAYGGQVSGKCLSMLPSPPTTSPTLSGGLAEFWYPDYDTAWSDAGCKNTLPLPFNNKNDRPSYDSQLECCKGAYAGQSSGKCLSELPMPPTTSPTGTGGADFWYPDYDTAWSEATCKNDMPLPFTKGGRPTYDSQLECCKGAYAGQVSGACIAALPNPPTSSPTDTGGLDFYWPDSSNGGWATGTCTNERPFPNNVGSTQYATKESCCTGAYGGQYSDSCMCDAVGVCYSCKCGTQAERDAAGCTLTCS